MRRALLSALLACGLALPVAAPAGAADQPDGAPAGGPGGAPALPAGAAQAAEQALEAAVELTDGEADPDQSASLVQADLLAALPQLDRAEQREARSILARPSDGVSDPEGFGWSDAEQLTATRDCGSTGEPSRVCVHYVTVGDDRATAKAAEETRQQLEEVWTHHVTDLGYRAPLSDRGRGGTPQFDVYLADTGRNGIYGYCAPERQSPGAKTASGYCVLDNDFADFPGDAEDNRRVTAAHEFFHAIQYAYDFQEDRWLLEATATWVEERFADEVDDNRQFLREGQVRRPGTPLDTFDDGTTAYGNWAFFEALSQRFGPRVVRSIWERAADFAGAPDQHSTQAVRTALRARGQHITHVYAAFAAGNRFPAAFYSEGSQWGTRAPVAGHRTLGSGRLGTGALSARLRHLTSRSWTVRRGAGIPGRRTLLVQVDGPDRVTGSVAAAVVRTHAGAVRRHVIGLGARGRATRRLAFGPDVADVTLTLVNGSTRYRCWRGTDLSCRGTSLDDGRRYTVSARAVR